MEQISQPMTPFQAQFDAPDKLEALQEEFIEIYAEVLNDEDEDPLGEVIQYFCDSYVFEIAPTRDALAPWVEQFASEVAQHRVYLETKNRLKQKVEQVRDLRGQGRGLLSVARSLQIDPAQLLLFMTQHAGEETLSQMRGLKQAHLEEHRLKTYRARQRLYKMIGEKVQAALEERDLSNVSTEKLIALMLRLSEVTKEDEPPQLTIQVGFKSL